MFVVVGHLDRFHSVLVDFELQEDIALCVSLFIYRVLLVD
jgi:hypothetical protein